MDAAGTTDDAGASIFLVNRSVSDASTVTIDVAALGSLGSLSIVEAVCVWGDDIHAPTALDDQERVGLRTLDAASLVDGTLTVTLPPVSWAALRLARQPLPLVEWGARAPVSKPVAEHCCR